MRQITLQDVTAFANKLLVERQKAEDAAAAATKQLDIVKRIEDELLPNMLREVGMMEFKLGDGRTVSVEPHIACTISAENFPAAEEWLQERDLDGIIKNQVVIEFDKGMNMAAENLKGALLTMCAFPKLFVQIVELCQVVQKESIADPAEEMAVVAGKKNIHPQTLKAFVREQMRKGVDVPEDLFSLFITDHVKIK